MYNNLLNIYKVCKDNITEIEGFYKAISDRSERYDCHHRLETHDEFGNLRNVLISSGELIKQDLYYNRPASELVFLKKSEHSELHRQFSSIDGHRYLNDESRRTEYTSNYRLDKDRYAKQLESNKKYQDKHREEIREYSRKYSSRLCLYEGETLTLARLSNRFRARGIVHPCKEAKKYLISEYQLI